MKWWWALGLAVTVTLLYVNDAWYGGAATFGVPIGWMISILILVKLTYPRRKVWSAFVSVFLVGATIVLSIPTYSVAAAEQELFTTYGSVTYTESVRTNGDEWNPFVPTVAYVFETETGESILFIPDSGKSFEL
ncbi:MULTISPECIES: hypothetical protein [unclassified Exiguobacterium]|uniref:hypothetical protein n=1 Tax=unclassified Exiguobacterium TaxID=2644629 RepID=UPI00103B02DC|nr:MULTISPECIES: hypothetical protein [unclassified Exiguobacterium]TCI42809.1 hypothetical protein EVJ31_13650 [Exiguobacterium sp. SH5S32]TCI50178.1 hypothetical protein EVJ25_12510 [Exiguobacterium sp. SH1S4]TCI53000.1 hypothetical protein EVJ24_10765 [Exiguobacterium sp. SH1S21]TCI67533.1 hypothetical protein EVJ23_13640 [Exiguobacterium sp. SH1S1]